MKRSQTITLLALGISLSACSNNHPDNTNHCDRSNDNYDQTQCDQQIQDSQHQYHHGGVAYYPWFRDNFNNSYSSRLNYGWNHGSTVFAPLRVSGSVPMEGTARAGTVAGTSAAVAAARGGFGSIGAAHAGGGGE